jgi:hypothetical protein
MFKNLLCIFLVNIQYGMIDYSNIFTFAGNLLLQRI